MNKRHLITTDNDFMAEVGLSAFTTGDLYTWVTANDGKNLGYLQLPPRLVTALEDNLNNNTPEVIAQGKAAAAFPIMDIMLGVDQSWLGVNKLATIDSLAGDPEAVITDFGFSRWRKEGRNSKDYAYYWVHDSSFNNWKVSFENQPGPNTLKAFDKDSLFLNNEDLNPTDGRYINNSISRIIEMNELVLDDGYLDLASTSDLIALRTARYNLIRDIKKSYEGGISWQSPSEAPNDVTTPDWRIVFNNINGDPCPQTVNFKLKLYTGESRPTKATAVNATRFFQAPVNHTNQDSRRSVTAETRAGELEISANPKSGKFEAGTKAILAVMETDLENAVAPDDGTLATPELWRDSEKGFQQKHGKARPLNDNGKNPYSFSPNLAHPERTAGNPKSNTQLNETMESVHVVNRLPNSSFTKGDIVLLHKIDSIWQPMAAQAKEPEPVYVTPTVGQWDFMYMISNADNYFKYKNAVGAYATVSFSDRENQFYDYYYTDPGDASFDAKASLLTGIQNSYIQVTSWDFMGAAVGGNRQQHALGQTQFARNVLGGYISAPDDQRGTVTAPFFGCVFPDGYRLKDGQFDEFKIPLEYDMKTQGNSEFYIRNIPKNTTVFAEQDNGNWRLDQDDADRVGEKSIFSHVFAGDETLHQLPADIATNAHPDSTIGTPLTNLGNLAEAFSHLAENSAFSVQDRVTDFLNSGLPLRHAWLEYSNGPNSGESTFEFTPLNKRRIQFRPLKAEVYSTFEKESASDGPNTVVPNTTDIAGGRGNYAAQSWQSISDGEIPVSLNVISRCTALGTLPFQGGVIGPIIDTIMSPGNPDLNPDQAGYYPTVIGNYTFKQKAFRCAVDIAANGNIKSRGFVAFPDDYWDESWNEIATETDATLANKTWTGGGIGVIGASCKVTANTEIIFNTICNYGMDSQFNVANLINTSQTVSILPGAGLVTDVAGAGMSSLISSLGGVQHGPWAGTFGGEGHRVDSLHETALFAKIFHSWPKLQTVYDSRYFAVYHFADGIGDSEIPLKFYSVKADSSPIEITGYTDDQGNDDPADDVQVTALEEYTNLKENIPDTDPVQQRAVEIGYLGGTGIDPPSIKTKFVVQQLTYTTATGIYPATDFREPTLVGDGATQEYGLRASAGDVVWKDGTGLPDSTDNGWRKPDHWRVRADCRGKLLPTQEEKMDIVLKIKSDEVGVYNEPEEAFDIVISDLGNGAYEEADTFTTKGGSGTGVVLEPILEGGDKGPLIGFTVVNRGTGFVPDDFFSKSDIDPDTGIIGTYQSATVKIVPIFSNNGDGLEAYVPIGIVYPSKHIIPKPLRATEEEFFQLSITPPRPELANATNQRAINAPSQVSAQIPVQNKSPDSAYDVFLHFHNDISHTFIEAQGPTPDCKEQAIEVTISPI